MSRINEKINDVIFELEQVRNIPELDNWARDVIKKAIVVIVKSVDTQEDQEDDLFYTVQETADFFKVSYQAVYKWIKQDKILFETDETPGGIHYRIPKNQFDKNDNIMQKRLKILEEIKQAKEKIRWTAEDIEDAFPLTNEEDEMEELDIE